MSQVTREDSTEESGWATGGVYFAAAAMLIIGCWQAIMGLAAIINDDFFVLTSNYAFDLDTTGWGWIHLILGVLVALAALALFAGKTWAAIVAAVLAGLSAVVNFFFIPYYPFWSLLIIALDVWGIWALTRPGTLRAVR